MSRFVNSKYKLCTYKVVLHSMGMRRLYSVCKCKATAKRQYPKMRLLLWPWSCEGVSMAVLAILP